MAKPSIDNRRRLDVLAWRESIVQGFMRVEDAVYAGLGTLLAAIALVLLVAVAVAFVRALLGDALPDHGLLRTLVLAPDAPAPGSGAQHKSGG